MAEATQEMASMTSEVTQTEPWPGCYADLQRRRVVTLATLGLMLSKMAGGEAAEVVGYDAADLYAEVLMALAIEDAEDTDIALEVARDHPEGDILTRLTAQSGEGRSGALLTSGNESRVMNKALGDCPDCAEGECSMNCSSAIQCTGSEWIAASIWAGVFPQRASAKQVGEYLAALNARQSGAGERV